MTEIGYYDYSSNVNSYSLFDKVQNSYQKVMNKIDYSMKTTENSSGSRSNLLTSKNTEDSVFAKTKLDSMSANMAKLLSKYGVNLLVEDNLLISFNPYSYDASVTGSSNYNTVTQFRNLINSSSNAKNLMNYAMSLTQNLNKDAVIKYNAFQEVKKYTGLNLAELTLKDGEFYTEDGEALKDLLKEGIEKSSVRDEFKTTIYNYTKGLVDVVAKKGWNSIDDLRVAIGYSKNNGFYTLNNIWEA